MNFKQSAALGIGALLVSGQLMMPSSAAINQAGLNSGTSQTDIQRQFARMLYNPVLMAVIQHPIQKENGILARLNPMNLFLPGFLSKMLPSTTARSIVVKPMSQSDANKLAMLPENPLTPVINDAMPQAEKASAVKAPKKLAVTRKASANAAVKTEAAMPVAQMMATPIAPEVAINPAITTIKQDSPAAAKPSKTTEPKQREAKSVEPQSRHQDTSVVETASQPISPKLIASKPVQTAKAEPAQAQAEPQSVQPVLRMKLQTVVPVIQAAQAVKADDAIKSETIGGEKQASESLETIANADTNADMSAAKAKPKYKQVFLPTKKNEPVAAVMATMPVDPEAANEPSSEAMQQADETPNYQAIYPTTDPDGRALAMEKAKVEQAKAHETFQMLATSALDKLVMDTKSANAFYSAALDNSAPEVDLSSGQSNVKVLKSGISQKIASVDIAIGKAEVIYLSKPAARVSVSNPDVATAVVISPTQIQLVGKAVGVANLLVWGDMMSPEHTAVDISVHRDVSVLVNQLKYVDPGIQIVPMAAEDTVILTGQAQTRESAQLAIEMAKAYFNKNGNIGAAPMNGPNSQAPGSAIPGTATNVINLIKVKGEPSTKIELVRNRLREIDPNIRVDVVPGPEGNEKVILTGRVGTASIASKALNLVSVFYGQPGLKMVTAQGGNDFTRMQPDSSSGGSSGSGSGGGMGGAGGSGSNGSANVLQGSVMTDATGNVISMLEIAQKPQIRCSIKFLELNKTSLNALGGTLSGVSGNTGISSWSGVQSAAPGKAISVLSTQDRSGASFVNNHSRTVASMANNMVFNEVYQNGITQAFTINNQLAGAIQALQERRQVRTLAEPTLTLLSGEQGSFLAGGEIPIAFVGGQGQVSIQYKEFGIRLNLLPNVTDDGKIQMQVSPEVSSLDQANGVSTNSVNVPAFITRRMNTTLLVEPGQSFVLAGLYNQQDTDSMSRFPGLGSLPILGTFFRNKWDNRTKSEMVVVIRPEIIMSSTGPTVPRVSELPTSPQPAQQTKISKK